MSKTEKMNDDATTLAIVGRFIPALNKHPDLIPLDILIVTYLMLRKAEDHDAWPSQLTLARAFNMDTRSIARSLSRLVKVGYLFQQHRTGRTSLYSLNYEAIPGEECLSEKVTQAARNISYLYQLLLQKKGRKKFPKRWLSQQFLSAQRIIGKCNGNADAAVKVIEFALSAKAFQQRASKSLYNLFRIWKPIATAYNALRKQEQAEAAALQAQQPPPPTTPAVTATEAAAK